MDDQESLNRAMVANYRWALVLTLGISFFWIALLIFFLVIQPQFINPPPVFEPAPTMTPIPFKEVLEFLPWT